MLNKPKALINDDYSIGIDTERYQGVLEHALSKIDFLVGIDIYMLSSNLNLTIGKMKQNISEARTYTNNVDEAMLEYYRVFAKKINSLLLEPELSDFYHPSENRKNGELLFAVVGTGVATYTLYKYLK